VKLSVVMGLCILDGSLTDEIGNSVNHRGH
jgi:hypothetical protein